MPIPTPSAIKVARLVGAGGGKIAAGGGAIFAGEVTLCGRGGGSRSSAGDGGPGGGGGDIGGGAASGGGEDITLVQSLQISRQVAPVFPFSGRIFYLERKRPETRESIGFNTW